MQRMERDGTASPESIMAIASAFSISPNELQSEYNEKIGDGKVKYAGIIGSVILLLVLWAALWIGGEVSYIVDLPSLFIVLLIPFGLSLISNGFSQTMNAYYAIAWLFKERKDAHDMNLLLPVIKKLIVYSYVAALTASLISALGMLSPWDKSNMHYDMGFSVIIIICAYSIMQSELVFRPLLHKLNRLLLQRQGA